MLKEFKKFAVKGNALDLAIGVVIGAAFGKIVSSLVADIINPILSVFISRIDFSQLTIPLPGDNTITYGVFISVVIEFLIIAFSIFLVVRAINKLREKENIPKKVKTKNCPHCKEPVNEQALRCPHCTSQLK